MCSRFRSELAIALVAAVLACAGCKREQREYSDSPQAGAPQADTRPRQSTLQPGVHLSEPPSAIGQHYADNAYHITQGGRLFGQYNCSGCHAHGGGAIGPALMDDQWRYGGSIDAIHASIIDGRPNGMPAWRGKLTDAQAWQLSAYVLALSGNVRKDAAPSRREGMASTPPLTQVPQQPPRDGDPSAANPPPP
jgi:cytochrome c oxidase cbb3-type subunit 3